MSIIAMSDTLGPVASGQLAGRVRRFYRTVAGWLADFARSQRKMSMQTFAAGNDRALKDVCISRAQANYMADRPVWGRSPALAIDPDRI